MAEAMDWAEIKRRLLDGTSVQILADLNGVTYKTMYNRIMAHQVKDGVTYLTPRNTKGLKKAKAISKTKQAQAREKEKAAAEKVGREIVEGLPKFEADPEKKSSAPEDPGKLPEVTALMPETMDEIDRNIEACLQLAARYKQQAEDWQQIRQAFALSFKGRKLPEVDT